MENVFVMKGFGRFYGGVDLGGTYIKCGIFDEEGTLLAKTSVPTRRERPQNEILEDIATALLHLAEENGIGKEALTAVGIGAPGTVDSSSGVIVYSNNLAWENVPVGEFLHGRLQKPVYVLNDANAAALGESAFGAGKGYERVILLTLGTGVGGGIVLNGELYDGKGAAGAEIGHEVIKLGGLRCTCGRRGCLEVYASAGALVRQARAAMENCPNGKLWELCGQNAENLGGKLFFEGVRLKDKTAMLVLKKYCKYLAAGIVNVANVFRPDIILLGGGIAVERDLLLPPLRRLLDREIFGGNCHATVNLDTATLGNDAGIYGSFEYARSLISRNIEMRT